MMFFFQSSFRIYSYNQKVDITIDAYDLATPPNIMTTVLYSFTIDEGPNNTPVMPIDPYPPIDTDSHFRQGVLYWGDGETSLDDPDPGDEVTFYVYIEANNSNPTNIYWSGVSPHQRCYYGNLEPDTKYYWKVVAVDKDSAVTEGPVWNFITESEPLLLLSPPPLETYSSPGTSPTGLVWDGHFFWTCDEMTNNIYKLDSDFSIINAYESPIYSEEYSKPTDLTWDGNNLWASIFGYGGRVVKFNNSMEVIESRYGYVTEGLAWAKDALLLGSSWTGEIELNQTTGRLALYHFGWQQNIYGMHWDGISLWISVENELYKCSYNDSDPGYIDITPEDKYIFNFIVSDIADDGQNLWIINKDDTQFLKLNLNVTSVDTIPPYTSNHSPINNGHDLPVNTNITLHVKDDDSGVNLSSIGIQVNGMTVIPVITGDSLDCILTYDPPVDFNYGETVTVSIDAADHAGNWMDTEGYFFITQMEGLVAYYPFNGNANDESGNGNHGTVYGASLIMDRFGNANNAYRFDGMDDFIITQQKHFAKDNNLSVSLWVYVHQSASIAEYFLMCSDFGVFQTSNQVGLAISLPATNSAQSQIIYEQWNHLVGSYDGNSIKVYINGLLKEETNHPGNISEPNRTLTFGKFDSFYWEGFLDDIRIFNRVMQKEEIQSLYRENLKVDLISPYTSGHLPNKDAVNVFVNTDIVVHVLDEDSGVKQSSILMKVNDTAVAPLITGDPLDYTVTYNPPADFEFGETVTVSIDAEDNAGNQMETEIYQFSIEHQSDNRITLFNGQGYDFTEGTVGLPYHGDFYFVEMKFWANNSGQRGVYDLGDIGSVPLDQVQIPESGYIRYGVTAVAGHTYVSLAQEGEEGNHIVFRVLDVFDQGVIIEFLYVYRDDTPPYTSNHTPPKDAIDVPVNTPISVHVQDDDTGVDSSGIMMTVNDTPVIPDITGTPADYTVTYDPPTHFGYGETVTVSVDAEDKAGNVMDSDVYSFTIRSQSIVPTVPDDFYESENVELVGRWGDGPCQAVAVSESIAYFGNGGYLEIVDFSVPESPVELARFLLPADIQNIFISENYAFIANARGGLHVIDISNPLTIQELDYFITNGYVWDVKVNGSFAYIACSSGLRIINISAIDNVYEVGYLNTLHAGYGIEISGYFAYIAGGYAGISIVDISLPENPLLLTTLDTDGEAYNISVAGNFAYVADGPAGLRILDVSFPVIPFEIGYYDTENIARDVKIVGDYAYIANWDEGLRVIDISTSSDPVEVGYYNTNGWSGAVDIGGNFAYVADSHEGLRVIDVADPSNLREVGFYDTGHHAWKVELSGRYAYLADNLDGVYVIDVSNPLYPQEIGHQDTHQAWDIALSEGYAYVADAGAGLTIIDISTPSNPVQTVNVNAGGMACGVAVHEQYVYVADNDGLRVYDISTPSNPLEIGYFDTEESATDVAINGNYAFVAAGIEGLWVIDVTAPENLHEVGYLNIEQFAEGIAISGDYAYLACIGGVYVIDVSQPEMPQMVGYYNTGRSIDISVTGDYAVVAADNKGIRVIDVSMPSTPEEVGYFETGDVANGVAIRGNYIYVADMGDGLYILKYTGDQIADSVNVTIRSNYPITGGPGYIVDADTIWGESAHQWIPGEIYQIGTWSPQMWNQFGVWEENTHRFLWNSWSDGGAIIHDYVCPDHDDTLTVNFEVELKLKVEVNPEEGGSVQLSPPGGWYDFDQTVQAQATPAPGYRFVKWIGSVENTTSTITIIVMDSAKKLDALFELEDMTSGTEVSGVVYDGAGGGPWTETGSPYIVIGDINIPEGETLIIEPGVIVKFDGFYEFICYGILNADGNSTDQITFTSNNVTPDRDDWQHIELFNSASVFQYCNVEYGRSGLLIHAPVNITNCKFKNNDNCGIYILKSVGSGSIITDSMIKNNCYGIIVEDRAQFRRNLIVHNSTNGVVVNSERSPDFGTDGDHGENAIYDNGEGGGTDWGGYQFRNVSSTAINAKYNFWDETNATAIDMTLIYDDDENPAYGAVIFEPFLTIDPFAPVDTDSIPPYPLNHNPVKNAFNVPMDVSIIVHIQDDHSGIDQSTIIMTVESETVAPVISGNPYDYTLTYTPSVSFTPGQVVEVTIECSDLAGNEMPRESYSFTISQSLDITPPVIVHTPVSTANMGESIILNTAADDAEGIKTVQLSFRRGGETSYASMDMAQIGGSSYQAGIPGTSVTERGLEYTISATDSNDNTATDPSGTPHQIRVIVPNLSTSRLTPSGAYRMVSVPLELYNRSAGDIFLDDLGSYDIKEWRLFRYQGGGYVEYSTGSIESANPGRGYWLITRQSKSWDTGSGQSVATVTPVRLTLASGWNMIGCPFSFPVSWGDVDKGGAYMGNPVAYSGSENEAEGYDYNQTVLSPWQGYLVQNLEGHAVTIDIPALETTSSAEKDVDENRLEPGEWEIEIIVEGGKYQDRGNRIGVNKHSEETWDTHDYMEVPAFGDYVRLVFPHEDWEQHPGLYSGDFRSLAGEGQQWQGLIQTHGISGEVRVVFRDLERLPEDKEIRFYDVHLRRLIDPREEPVYAYPVAGEETERSISILVGTEDDVLEQTEEFRRIPEILVLYPNYPNPFNNSTMLRFSLPDRSRVSLSVYDVTGRIVRTIIQETEKEAGIHEVIWDGRDDGGRSAGSGIYVVLLRSGLGTSRGKIVLVE